MPDIPAGSPIAVRQWHASLGAPASNLHDEEGGVSLSRYVETGATMEQPALAEHLLCLHLGGAKRVQRLHAGRTTEREVEERAITLIPALHPNRWTTHGPIDFVHLTLGTTLMNRLALEEYDLDVGAWTLPDTIGLRDAEIGRLILELLRIGDREPFAGRLYPESLRTMIAIALIGRHCGISSRGTPAFHRGGMAEWRLRQVIDFMASHLAEDIGLADLVRVSGLSRAQFFRAFQQSTGLTPHRYLAIFRLKHAADLLRGTGLSIAEVTARVGLKDNARFRALFRRRFGVRPADYR